jgi:hypothetical protein
MAKGLKPFEAEPWRACPGAKVKSLRGKIIFKAVKIKKP